jgi:excisionase family DNA binding protein
MQDYVSVKEASERFGLSDSRIRQLLGKGVIQGRKFGNAWAILVSSLEGYTSQNRKPGPPKQKGA